MVYDHEANLAVISRSLTCLETFMWRRPSEANARSQRPLNEPD